MSDIEKKLKAPFSELDIEWRLQSCGIGSDGIAWGRCLAYINARAVMDRLDEVVGPANWADAYSVTDKGILCSISLYMPGDTRWVTKTDGAEATDIEPFKGGISGAFKRAASKWGVGRYLYALPEGWAQIVAKETPGALYGKTKEGKKFYWLPPSLPAWALPEDQKPKQTQPDPVRTNITASAVATIDTSKNVAPSKEKCAELRRAIRENKWDRQDLVVYKKEWVPTLPDDFKAEDLTQPQLEKLLVKVKSLNYGKMITISK